MSSAHMITHHGLDHYLSGPEVHTNLILLTDIAHALSQINRYTGHAKRPYSVAEHSLLVAQLIEWDGHPPLAVMAGLMHDAHEAYTGDASSPAKQAVGLAWSQFEALQADHVRRALRMTTAFIQHRDLLHRYDLIALATERYWLMNYMHARNQYWMVLDNPAAPVLPDSRINLSSVGRIGRTWLEWRQEFIERFNQLHAEIWPGTPSSLNPPTQEHTR